MVAHAETDFFFFNLMGAFVKYSTRTESYILIYLWQAKAIQIEFPINFFQLDHVFGESVTDLQLQGAQFTSEDGRSFAVTGYDNNDLIFYSQK